MEYREDEFTDALIEHFEKISKNMRTRRTRRLRYKRHNYVTRGGIRKMWIKRKYPSYRFSSVFY